MRTMRILRWSIALLLMSGMAALPWLAWDIAPDESAARRLLGQTWQVWLPLSLFVAARFAKAFLDGSAAGQEAPAPQ